MNPELVLILLKAAVLLITALLGASLLALARGQYRVHGWLNRLVFALVVMALVGLEGLARLIQPGIFHEYFDRTGAWPAFYLHLAFALPTAGVLCALLYTGLGHRRSWHIVLGLCFLGLWTGTLVTGLFFLPPFLGR